VYSIFPEKRGGIVLLWDKLGAMCTKNIFTWDGIHISFFSEKCVYTYIFPRYQYSGFLSIEPQKISPADQYVSILKFARKTRY